MTVNTNRLCERKTGFGAVQVTPASLYESDLRIHDKVGYGLQEEVLLRNEVGVENSEEFSLCDFHAFLESAGLEILAVRAVDKLDVIAAGGEFGNFLLRDFVAFVCGVVQDLDLVFVLGIVYSADRFEKALHAVGFVKNRELGRDLGEVRHGMFAVVLQDCLAVRKTSLATILEE